jgi:purine-binding chemotaxis protein CheW
MSPAPAPPSSPAADNPMPAPADRAAPATRIDTALVVLTLGPAEFALPIRSVREVLRAPVISRVPFAPPAVCGVFGLRGEVIPVIDLGERLFGQPARRPGSVVVVRAEGMAESAALLVDSVPGLIDAGQAEVYDTPAEAEATLPAGWAVAVVVPEPGRLVTLLDLLQVLGAPQTAPSSEGSRTHPAAEGA